MTVSTSTTATTTKTGDQQVEVVEPTSDSSSINGNFIHGFHDENSLKNSQVIKFYRDKNVLITGASGFLGKVLLWKLLIACKDIGTIYVLIRSKNNLSSEKRLMKMLKEKPFKFDDGNELMKKVVAIESDITQVGLGLSNEDRQMLQVKVNIVFHCAASVKFDAPLKENLRDNYYGTQSIVNLCDELEHLNAFVHVSTAFSNCHKHDIEETIIPLRDDVENIVNFVENLPDNELINELSVLTTNDKLLEGRPNTYTYTKAIAEQYVAKQEGKYPISIVRPSIVISSKNEPSPGWIDNINGLAGLGCLASIGVLRTIDWNYYATSDMVPVDYVANCLICAAYQTSVYSPKKMLIFNMTSGNMKPISWGKYFLMLRETATKKPPNKIVRPMIEPPKYKRANQINFFLTRFFSELLFAYMVDIIITLIGYKKLMVKITKKMHHGYKILLPFTTNEWNFISKNVTSLSDSLTPIDRKLFKFDMRDFNWQDEASVFWDGIRSHILHEEPTEESYRNGKNRQKLVTIVHYFLTSCFMAVSGFAIYSCATLVV